MPQTITLHFPTQKVKKVGKAITFEIILGVIVGLIVAYILGMKERPTLPFFQLLGESARRNRFGEWTVDLRQQVNAILEKHA